ncbi:hypothetical protein [Ruegeria lacuscaerulensis]|uniref:hypothetical protein n=1 Tax=Ruegeria lacuscaerulensis TaxID=55218 RepID=UPI001480A399|nr:hypothetical protein [Ruegeria lacuscaerulensis]
MKAGVSELRYIVDSALSAPYRRVTRCEMRCGAAVWLKRIERSDPHLWVVKGLPGQAFDRDRRSHRFLRSCGVPVPAVLLESDSYFVVEDAGHSLSALCGDPLVAKVEKLAACIAAGQALARLHAADLAHGRPAFRDMCWDGRRIRFIDFEYFDPSQAGSIRKARDIGIALLSALSQGGEGLRFARSFLSAYRLARRKRSKPYFAPLWDQTR